MKRFALTLSLVTLAISGQALAQKPSDKDFLPPAPKAAKEEPRRIDRPFEQDEPSPSDLQGVSLTPEMWLYMQELKRHDDPKQAVRRKAEQRSADRRARLAAMHWYGFSNLRPQASASPWMSTYSPFWAGNSWDPYRHVGVGHPGIDTAYRVEQYEWRR